MEISYKEEYVSMKLLLNLVYKDFKRNKVITITLTFFLMISTLFMAGGLRVTGTIISSMKGLNELAIPPQYLQMHKGDYDENVFKGFVENHEYINDSIIVKMLDIRNANIIYQGETLENSLMDNGFVIQNEGFDFLLNMNNDIVVVKEGEIGVPVYYAEDIGIQVGDTITLHEGNYTKNLRVSTIIRDSSMNAALTSSKRFLINQTDLDEISGHMGEWEYLFEFILEEGTSTAILEKDYIDANMPSNGVAITGSQLSIMNNLSHGLIALIIIAISILLIMIAVLCLSYIIKATLADENHTIGEMKAIGFPNKAIEKLYQMKYIVLVLIASVVGYMAAIPFGDFFSSSAVMYCGNGTDEWMKWIFPLIGVILLSIIVIFRCKKTIYKNLRSSVVELLKGNDRIKKEGHYSLPIAGLRHGNLSIALGELKCKWKEYVVIFFVFIFSSFLILLPMNMKNTVENPSFMTYMGVGESDIRIDIQYTDKLIEQKDAAISYLEGDPEIAKYAIYQNSYVELQNSDGEWEYLRVENGDGSIFPLEYIEGGAPKDTEEIALSYLNASELGKDVGDHITVSYGGEELLFTVSGIYQDITYGGKTAKANIDFEDKDVEVYIIYLDVMDGVDIEEKTLELRSILTDSKITPISKFVSQTLGGITDNLSVISGAAIVISLVLVMLITVMILRLITAREHSAIAIKKSIGFSNKDIRIQFAIRILLIQFVAIVVGTLLANTIGEVILGMILSFMGASEIQMLVEPIKSYLLSPAAQLFLVFITVIVGSKVVKGYHIRGQIME
ncbi:MAG: ABC transporter permease [Peptostreptococcales bacterium]